MTKTQFRMYGLITLVVALILAVFGITHALGYRVTTSGIVKASSLEIFVEKEGSKVFVNNSREAVTDRDGETVKLKNLTPGIHEILISKDGYWPWAKQINLEKDTTANVGTFTLISNVEGIIIPKEDPEYASIIAHMAAIQAPNAENPIMSQSGNATAWIEGNTIVARWVGDALGAPLSLCPEKKSGACNPQMVFSGTETIESLDFQKDRDDVLLFSASNGIFGIEVDKVSIQNFQPLYKGVAIGTKFFTDRTDNVLYVKDGELLLIINL